MPHPDGKPRTWDEFFRVHGIPVGDEPPGIGPAKQALYVLDTVPGVLDAATTEDLTFYLECARGKAEMMKREGLDPEKGRDALLISTTGVCPGLADGLYRSSLGLAEQVTAIESYLEVVRTPKTSA